jgi:hypothetical protein
VVSVLLDLSAAAIGWVAAVSFAVLRRRWRRGRRVRAFQEFFGTSGKILVIHSAVLDPPSAESDVEYPVYNYPATDIRSTRLLAALFESIGLKEGVDFNILPDIKVKADDNLWDRDLVLLCGPARNHVFRELNSALRMRYSMELDQSGANVLRDTLRGGQQMLTSRELPQPLNGGHFDYGIVASLPNPNNHNRKIVVLAGVHGTGTVGATKFLTQDDELQNLVMSQKGRVVCELVKASYDDDVETPANVRLV